MGGGGGDGGEGCLGAQRLWGGGGCMHGSGYPDRREQEVKERDGWCGGARPKKSHQCLPHVRAGGLSCGGDPECSPFTF